MFIKYLGTGAAEGIPAVFCHCNICEHARKYKGKNIRTRSQILIDEKILIDFGPDTYYHSLKYNIELANIYECFITHAHDDHLYSSDLMARRRSRANLKVNTPKLNIYGGLGVKNILNPKEDGYITKDNSILFCEIKEFDEIDLWGEYIVIPIPAVHKTEEPFVYIIKNKNSCFLYAHDTDYFDEKVWDYFYKNKIYFNAISLDCTEGIKDMQYTGHMNFDKMKIMCERLRKEGCIDSYTKIIANHFSHNGLVSYDTACEIGKNLGYIISYDGMEINV